VRDELQQRSSRPQSPDPPLPPPPNTHTLLPHDICGHETGATDETGAWSLSSPRHLLAGKDGNPVASKYDLVANLVHDGNTATEGSYRVHVLRKADNSWYEVQDLHVTDILPQMVVLSEAYMQVGVCLV
jgi:Ubiquitin carboxyl-terminal hydrolase